MKRLFRNARVAALTIAGALVLVACGGNGTSQPLTLNRGPAPWPNPTRVPARVVAAGLPHTADELTAIHYHSHLDIFVNGRSVPVATSLGRVDFTFFSPLHTHATSGMIHIEAGEDLQFSLKMLFTEWGVRITNDCVGGYCRPATPIAVYVDGQPDPTSLPGVLLRKGREIALVIGSPPKTIPSHWDCRAHVPNENPAQCADFEA